MEQFLQHLFQWTVQNKVVWGMLLTIILGIIGLVAAPAKVVKLGFNISQFVRKIGGQKAEKLLENIIDELEQGLHSDDAK
jgi:uncharacterized membrane protein YeaQ/YmgE (transglycosylase-associated protein family)